MKDILAGGKAAAYRLAQLATDPDAKILLLMFAVGCAPEPRQRVPGADAFDGSGRICRRSYGTGARRL